jgi:hypothetical protein
LLPHLPYPWVALKGVLEKALFSMKKEKFFEKTGETPSVRRSQDRG